MMWSYHNFQYDSNRACYRAATFMDGLSKALYLSQQTKEMDLVWKALLTAL